MYVLREIGTTSWCGQQWIVCLCRMQSGRRTEPTQGMVLEPGVLMTTIAYHHTERRSGVPDELEALQKKSKYKDIQLKENDTDTTDYLLIPDKINLRNPVIGVERKSMNDLVNSMKENKIPTQLMKIIDNGDIPVFLVEGIVPDMTMTQMSWESVYGYMNWLDDSGLSVKHTVDTSHTALTLMNMATRMEDNEFGVLKVPVIRKKDRLPVRQMLMSIPSVGEELSNNILETYRNLEEFLLDCKRQSETGTSGILELPRVGQKVADKIASEVVREW